MGEDGYRRLLCAAGEECWEEFETGIGVCRFMRIRYKFQTREGELFTCVARTLGIARDKRDHWLLGQRWR